MTPACAHETLVASIIVGSPCIGTIIVLRAIGLTNFTAPRVEAKPRTGAGDTLARSHVIVVTVQSAAWAMQDPQGRRLKFACLLSNVCQKVIKMKAFSDRKVCAVPRAP